MLLDQVLAVGVAHDLAVERAGLAEVVVLGVLGVRVAADLRASTDQPMSAPSAGSAIGPPWEFGA